MFRPLSHSVRLLIGALTIMGCGDVVEPPPQETTDPPVEEPTSVAMASNELGFALHRHLGADEGNLAYAPASVSVALAMTYAGARGQTATEMETALNLPADPAAVHEGWATLLLDWRQQPELAIANRLFGDAEFPWAPEFVGELESSYGAPLALADFRHDAEAERLVINEWVAEQTQDFIQNLLPEDALDEWTKVVLVNAMYFEATWQTSFGESETAEATFHAPDGDVMVPMMKGRFEEARFGSEGDVRLVELPYDGPSMAALFVLPEAGTSIEALESELDAATFETWLAALSEGPVEVRVQLPRFEVATTEPLELSEPLEALGMTTAFTKEADFTGMSSDPIRRIQLDEVYQKVVVKVDEEGTEAAAATAVVGGEYDSGPPTFRADRPFLFFIYDRSSSAILFAGRVSHPEQG